MVWAQLPNNFLVNLDHITYIRKNGEKHLQLWIQNQDKDSDYNFEFPSKERRDYFYTRVLSSLEMIDI